jgi:hypothetical protein
VDGVGILKACRPVADHGHVDRVGRHRDWMVPDRLADQCGDPLIEIRFTVGNGSSSFWTSPAALMPGDSGASAASCVPEVR